MKKSETRDQDAVEDEVKIVQSEWMAREEEEAVVTPGQP